MTIRKLPAVGLALLLACSATARAADAQPEQRVADTKPVKHVPIYVTPYYHCADAADGSPKVEVGKKFDALLSSTKREDILAVRDLIESDPKYVTPMTLTVLAIRCYDVGLRDDSVFWFYVAKERYLTMRAVLDVKSPQLSEVGHAMSAFSRLAGDVINGYAFCDLAKQKAAKAKAVAWVEKNRYETLFLPKAPALPGDREANLKSALEEAHKRMKQEQEYFDDPAKVAEYKKIRAENGADKRYCWESN